MKRSQHLWSLGSLQPLLFCIGMYFVVLIFSVFVCSSLYNAFQDSPELTREAKPVKSASDRNMVASIR